MAVIVHFISPVKRCEKHLPDKIEVVVEEYFALPGEHAICTFSQLIH